MTIVGLGWPAVTAPITGGGRNAWARLAHRTTLLLDGSVIDPGGSATRSGGGTVAPRPAERFDPEHGDRRPAAAMTDARTAHTAVPVADGVIRVVGGTAPTGAVDDPALTCGNPFRCP